MQRTTQLFIDCEEQASHGVISKIIRAIVVGEGILTH